MTTGQQAQQRNRDRLGRWKTRIRSEGALPLADEDSQVTDQTMLIPAQKAPFAVPGNPDEVAVRIMTAPVAAGTRVTLERYMWNESGQLRQASRVGGSPDEMDLEFGDVTARPGTHPLTRISDQESMDWLREAQQRAVADWVEDHLPHTELFGTDREQLLDWLDQQGVDTDHISDTDLDSWAEQLNDPRGRAA